MKQIIVETLPGHFDLVEKAIENAINPLKELTEITQYTIETESTRWFVSGYDKSFDHMSESNNHTYFETIIKLEKELTDTKQIDHAVRVQTGYRNVEITCLTKL